MDKPQPEAFTAWGVSHNFARTVFHISRSVRVNGKWSDVEWLRNERGGRRVFRSERAAEAVAAQLNKLT